MKGHDTRGCSQSADFPSIQTSHYLNRVAVGTENIVRVDSRRIAYRERDARSSGTRSGPPDLAVQVAKPA
jgi:hypothetical protein